MPAPMHPTPSRRDQCGVAVLHVTLILVLLASLGVFYTSRGAITEQRVSANEIRSQVAYQAALAGMDQALAYFDEGRDVMAIVNAGGASGTASSPSPLRRGSYRVTFCSPSVASAPSQPQCPTSVTASLTCTPPASSELRAPQVIACGWNDDGTAVVGMAQRVAGTPTTAGKITTPIVTYGSNNMLTGGGSILNYFNDLTVWSGGPVPTQSATGKTFVRNVTSDPVPNTSTSFTEYRDVGNSPSCGSPPAHYVCST